MMPSPAATRDGPRTAAAASQDLSLASASDDGQQQVNALFASAVHLIRVRAQKTNKQKIFPPLKNPSISHRRGSRILPPPPPLFPTLALRIHIHTQEALYNNPQSTEDVDALFSDGFHPKLKAGERGGRIESVGCFFCYMSVSIIYFCVLFFLAMKEDASSLCGNRG